MDVGSAEVCVVRALDEQILGCYLELYKNVGYMCHDQKLAYIYQAFLGEGRLSNFHGDCVPRR